MCPPYLLLRYSYPLQGHEGFDAQLIFFLKFRSCQNTSNHNVKRILFFFEKVNFLIFDQAFMPFLHAFLVALTIIEMPSRTICITVHLASILKAINILDIVSQRIFHNCLSFSTASSHRFWSFMTLLLSRACGSGPYYPKIIRHLLRARLPGLSAETSSVWLLHLALDLEDHLERLIHSIEM